MVGFLVYCISFEGEAFESRMWAREIPRSGDEICIEKDGFTCEMEVCGVTWVKKGRILEPTVQLTPSGGCKNADFVGIGWKRS
jgi:hypothetical protein